MGGLHLWQVIQKVLDTCITKGFDLLLAYHGHRAGAPVTVFVDDTGAGNDHLLEDQFFVIKCFIVLGQDFFKEITRSAVSVDLRAIRRVHRSPLAIDLYVWLTYRMSYLRKPTVVPWESLEAQFGADYGRPRDFRRRVSKLLESILRTYPTARISLTDTGIRLYPSPPPVRSRPQENAQRSLRHLATRGSGPSFLAARPRGSCQKPS